MFYRDDKSNDIKLLGKAIKWLTRYEEVLKSDAMGYESKAQVPNINFTSSRVKESAQKDSVLTTIKKERERIQDKITTLQLTGGKSSSSASAKKAKSGAVTSDEEGSDEEAQSSKKSKTQVKKANTQAKKAKTQVKKAKAKKK
jgi:hypothetical protein